ncbi:MAG: flavodoxin domain-containing protein [Spirochaetales bacterium]|nr:flavodoxin domain-containing protein [Spirochaetales bacterium]
MILYASKYGSVREYVGSIQEAVRRLESAASPLIFDLSKEAGSAAATLSAGYDDKIVLVTPVYAGRAPKAMRRFVESQHEALRTRPVALVLACLYEDEEARQQMMNVFPSWLVGHASRQFFIGGRIHMAALSGPTRFMIKRVLRHNNDVDTLAWDAAAQIAEWFLE